MRTVGLRELKNRLSEYIRYVRTGEGVMVTDHGRVVAELRPPGATPNRIDAPLGLLVNRGVLTLGASNTAKVYPRKSPLLRATSVSKLLEEERGGR